MIKTYHLHQTEKGFLVEGEIITIASTIYLDEDEHKDALFDWLENNVSSRTNIHWGISIVVLSDAQRKSPFRILFQNEVDAALFNLAFKAAKN